MHEVHIAVVGAGPVGLALALHAARVLPAARITVFDARAATHDVAADPRTLALSLGSVQFLQRLVDWAPPQAIAEVQVSQQPPSFGDAEVRIRAAELGVPLLGAVATYGEVVAPLQRGWEAAVAAEPRRLAFRLGTAVQAVKPVAGGVELDADIAESFDLAVVAEGGVFAGQVRKAVVHDYRQTAWVGTLTLDGLPPGVAFERFTRDGPLALLPRADGRASLVWCVPSDDDPVRPLAARQRLALLAERLPAAAGRPREITPLKDFALGLNAERTLVDGRSVRIGNAAQTLHPVAGQGLNLGLRDAHELVAALRHAADVDAALARVEWARSPDRWATIATTDFLARSFTWQLPGLGLARGLGLAALQQVAPARHWLARRMMFGSR
ncbi:MAG: FAD-dependent monooxygenase [Rubrivivax sp.]